MKTCIILMLSIFLLSGCSNGKPGEPSSGLGKQARVRPQTVKITTAVSSKQDIEIRETALGRIIDPVAVTIGAEERGRVVSVLVDAGEAVAQGQLMAVLDDSDAKVALATTKADVKRLQAQLQAQQNLVRRYRSMMDKHFISPTVLEQAQAQLAALLQSKKAAQARMKQARNNLRRTRITAPITGHVEQRLVAAGDYINRGKPLFRMVTGQRLTVSIPLPETRAALIHKGQTVHLHLPADTQVTTAKITNLTPMVGRGDAFEARVELDNPARWRPGGSVVADIITARRIGAVVVPEESVVLRPAGYVVYRIRGNIARAVSVLTGAHVGGKIELRSGLKAGEVIAADGAAYLNDGARVEIHHAGSKPHRSRSDGFGSDGQQS